MGEHDFAGRDEARKIVDVPRGVVTGDDWKQPELRDRYAGWYSTYLERRLR